MGGAGVSLRFLQSSWPMKWMQRQQYHGVVQEVINSDNMYEYFWREKKGGRNLMQKS